MAVPLAKINRSTSFRWNTHTLDFDPLYILVSIVSIVSNCIAYKHEEIAFAFDFAGFDPSSIIRATDYQYIVSSLLFRNLLFRKYRFFASPEIPRARKRPRFLEAIPLFVIILISIHLSLSQYLLRATSISCPSKGEESRGSPPAVDAATTTNALRVPAAIRAPDPARSCA